MYLSGTFDALPAGKSVPRAADLEVRFGQPIAVAELRSRIAGLARSEGYKAATQVIEDAVRTLRESARGERREATSKSTPTEPRAPTRRPKPRVSAAERSNDLEVDIEVDVGIGRDGERGDGGGIPHGRSSRARIPDRISARRRA